MGFMDDKDASRTIRTGFTDIFVASRALREVTDRRFVMDESIYKAHLAWLLLIHTLHFDEDTSIQQLYNRYWRYLRIYFVGILSQNFFFFLKRKCGYFCKMPPKKRSKRRSSHEGERMSTKA